MSDSFDLGAATDNIEALKSKTADLTAAASTFVDLLSSLSSTMSALGSGNAGGISSGLQSIVSGLTGGGGVKAFASGGVIGTPSYFQMEGGTGLAGEAGPEAILPLQRGADGSLGVATQGGGGSTVHVQIATPDAASFRRSESYVTGQIARAVARGQRSL